MGLYFKLFAMFEEFLAFRFKDGKLQPIAHPHLPSF